MGLQKFERRLERLVEGAFAKAFRTGLHPRELVPRVVREMDQQRTVGVKGVIVPNHFTVAIAPSDHERLQQFADTVCRELEDAARDHARGEGYQFVGPVKVELVADDRRGPGEFLVAGETREGPGGAPVGSVIMPDGSRVPLSDDPLLIGRSPECDIMLPDPSVTRRHAEIRLDDGGFLLVDLGSLNGTRVNGQGVRQRRLADGDEIRVGDSRLRFESS